MEKHEAEKIIETIRGLIEKKSDGDKPPAKAGKLPVQPVGEPLHFVDVASATFFDDVDKERLYQQFKARILTECPIDPVLLHLVTTRPEVRVEVEPRTVKLEEESLRGRIALLIADGFINAIVVKRADIVAQLSRTGSTPAGNRLSEALTSLVNDGILIRGEEDGWYSAAPGITITKQVIERIR